MSFGLILIPLDHGNIVKLLKKVISTKIEKKYLILKLFLLSKFL
jgi:hypothetical protein